MSSVAMLHGSLPSALQPAFVSHDCRFETVVGDAPRLEHVAAVDAHEGPVYVEQEDALYFTTLPVSTNLPAPGHLKVAIKRLQLDGDRFPTPVSRIQTVRDEANAANGMALDRNGDLIVCEQGGPSRHARIARVDRATGEAQTIVEQHKELPLNSPNDVVVKSDGTIWFTDPSYGYLQGFKPEPVLGDNVYRYDAASRSLTIVADGFDKPNGLAFSPDEDTLYVTDSGANQERDSYYVGRPHHIRALGVIDARRLDPGRLFAVTTPGFPDGIKVDADGRVYASSFGGVQVFSRDGDLIGEIRLPGAVNFAFGGPERNVLFITTDVAVWAAVLNVAGPTLPARVKPEGSVQR